MNCTLALALALSWTIVGGRAEAGQAAASVPLSLGVTATPSEATVGGTATVVVTIKNYRGSQIGVSEPLSVSLHSDLGGDSTVVFRPGQSSAQSEVRFPRAGVATIVATGAGMSSGSATVVVKAMATVPSQPAPAPPGTAHPASAAPPPPAMPHVIGLAVDVLPQHVHPANATWKAAVLVTAIDEARQPVAVPADTPVYLAADIGILMPATAVIKKGKARSDLIQLTSNRPGAGTLWAWTDEGNVTTSVVEYHDAVPSQLLVKALPTQVVNDGKTAVNVTVFLQDETSAIASTSEPVAVKLTSSTGTPAPSSLSIAKGQFFAEALLTSPTSGLAEITASAPRLKPGTTQVRFVFPLLLVMLAAAGGTIGSIVRSARDLFTGTWWWHLMGSAGMGVVLGLVFYALASFGVIASIPKLPLPLAQLPTTNDLAALVLGFLGGYYGRLWLPDPSAV